MDNRTSVKWGGRGVDAGTSRRQAARLRARRGVRAAINQAPGWVSTGFLFLFAASALPSTSVSAQEMPGDPAEGRRLAQSWCSGCHRVEERAADGAAVSSDAGPPSFASVARMPSTTALSLRVFLRTPHPPMPDFRLSEAQIADVSAYILSLRGQ